VSSEFVTNIPYTPKQTTCHTGRHQGEKPVPAKMDDQSFNEMLGL
jgi:hypothetical protein